MRFLAATAATLALVSSALTAPITLKSVKKFGGQVNPGSYIVKFKSGAPVASAESLGAGATVTHNDWDKSFFNGFSAKLDDSALNKLRADPNVDFIEEDGIMHTSVTTTQTDAPWGISRIGQDGPESNTNPLANSFTYRFDSAAGQGVDVYVVDTGINIDHVDFGGRARWGKTFGPNADADGNGHGTHCAGSIAGQRWGVAKGANVIAVKVLDDQGSGATSDIISGLNFVLSSARSSNRPSVASMSFGGPASQSLDNAVASLAGAGIHAAVAAGNDGADAGNTSPARVPSANTVGATDITDTMASFSNFGSALKIFAPGVQITSTWIGSTTATNTISGTSMATPHVAGLIAYLISTGGNTSPSAMTSKLQSLAVKDAIRNIPSGTINALARNDIK